MVHTLRPDLSVNFRMHFSIYASFIWISCCHGVIPHNQPWPISVERIAGACCDLYFDSHSYNHTDRLRHFNDVLQINLDDYFSTSTKVKEKSLLGCLLHQSNFSKSRELNQFATIASAVYVSNSSSSMKKLSASIDEPLILNGFVDRKIMQYAHLHYAIVSAYAEHNKYSYRFLLDNKVQLGYSAP